MAFGIDTRSKFKQTKQNKSKNCVYYCDKRHKTMYVLQAIFVGLSPLNKTTTLYKNKFQNENTYYWLFY